MESDLADLTDDELAEAYQLELDRLGLTESELVEETATAIETYSRLEVEFPLAVATLWQQPEAPCDQRRLVASLVHSLTLALGGNRSGKTYAIKEAAVAFALGGDHPAVMAWLEDNDLPRDLIPDGPGHVALVAQSAPDSMRYHRRDVDALLPRGGKQSWSLGAPQEARIECVVPGYDRPAVLWFKSIDQGHRSFKGSEFRFVAISEEPEGEEGRLVLDECMRGCSSVGGRVVIEMTPQLGFTWVHEELVEKRKYGAAVIEIDTTHNVMLPDYGSVMRWLDSLSPEERAMRQRGQFVDRRGLVYAEWSRGDGDRWGPGNLCEPFEIPADWPRFRGADFGLVNPTAVVWGALGDDGTLYVYREHYGAGPTYAEHGDLVRLAEAGEVIQAGWGDPSAPAAMSEWASLDVYLDPADNAVSSGISQVRDRMRRRSDGRPRLKVFRTCTELVREVEGYRWDPRLKVPMPVKKNDHACDALRYMVVGIADWLGL
jgi:hypothetical protein